MCLFSQRSAKVCFWDVLPCHVTMETPSSLVRFKHQLYMSAAADGADSAFWWMSEWIRSPVQTEKVNRKGSFKKKKIFFGSLETLLLLDSVSPYLHKKGKTHSTSNVTTHQFLCEINRMLGAIWKDYDPPVHQSATAMSATADIVELAKFLVCWRNS